MAKEYDIKVIIISIILVITLIAFVSLFIYTVNFTENIEQDSNEENIIVINQYVYVDYNLEYDLRNYKKYVHEQEDYCGESYEDEYVDYENYDWGDCEEWCENYYEAECYDDWEYGCYGGSDEHNHCREPRYRCYDDEYLD